jgi:hypothetical protein
MELAAAALIWEQHIRAAAFISREHDSKEFFFHDALERLGDANSAGKELPPVRRFCSFMPLNERSVTVQGWLDIHHLELL